MLSIVGPMRLRERALVPLPPRLRTRVKRWGEARYWKKLVGDPAGGNAHFEFFFTEYFGLDRDFYEDKAILDVGCGPRGTLEWATHARERIGADPLADEYLALGADQQSMRYVQTEVENLPFPDDHFDVVSSFNSLDHVENVERAVSEIGRVIRPEGTFLLLVEVGHKPTWTEPHTLAPDFHRTLDGWRVESESLCARINGMYHSLRKAQPGQDLLAARLTRIS
jgi:SAM-dependent methyltransferase